MIRIQLNICDTLTTLMHCCNQFIIRQLHTITKSAPMEFHEHQRDEDGQPGPPGNTHNRITFTRLEKQKLDNARSYIDNHLHLELTIPILAKKFLLSTTYLKAGFRQEFGRSVHQYVLQQRMAKAKELLLSGARVRQVAADIGYSLTGFSKVFKSYTGLSPIVFRNRYK